MAMIEIKNISEYDNRKYGQTFIPGETKLIDSEIINSYSLMEISLALQRISNNFNKEVSYRDMDRHLNFYKEYKEPRIIENFIHEKEYFINKPWLIFKIEDIFLKIKKILNKEAKPRGN